MKVATSSKKDLPDYWKEYIKSSEESSFKKDSPIKSSRNRNVLKYTIFLILFLCVIALYSGYLLYARESKFFRNIINKEEGKVIGVESNQQSNKKTLESQLKDVEEKIKELPELEENIFLKCMEGKETTEENVGMCQLNTQSQIYTLSQDLISLRKYLNDEIEKQD